MEAQGVFSDCVPGRVQRMQAGCGKGRLRRKSSLVAGAASAIVLAVASFAAACVPGQAPKMTKFEVRNASGTSAVRSAKAGDRLRAVGRNIDKPAWPYQIKLLVEPYDSSNTGNCGYNGIPQAVAQTTPTVATWNIPPQRFTGNFDVQFLLDPGVEVGPAHFCAVANWNRDGSAAPGIEALEYYIYEPFTVQALTVV